MNWAHPSSCIMMAEQDVLRRENSLFSSSEADVGVGALEGTQLGEKIQYLSHHNYSKTSKYLYYAS